MLRGLWLGDSAHLWPNWLPASGGRVTGSVTTRGPRAVQRCWAPQTLVINRGHYCHVSFFFTNSLDILVQLTDESIAYGLYCLRTVYSRLPPSLAKVVSGNSPALGSLHPVSACVGKQAVPARDTGPVSRRAVWKLGWAQAGVCFAPYPVSPPPLRVFPPGILSLCSGRTIGPTLLANL